MIELRDYKIKNVAIYLRKSRGESDVDLQKQQDTLTEICSIEGWEYEIYEEIANSDSLELRAEAQRLLADVEFGMYHAVLVVAVDRLSRAGSRDSDIVRKYLIDSSTFLIENTTIYNLEDDSSDINYNVKSLISQLEYKLIKKRLRSGKVQAAKRGFWPNGVPPLPYGYNKINKTLEIDDLMLVTYRYIIDAVVKDKKTTNEISYELNRQDMKTKQNNLWTSKTVRDILLDMTHLQYNDTKFGHIVIGKSKGEAHKKKKTSISLKFKKIASEDWRKFKGNHPCLKSTEEHKFIEVFLARKTKAPRKSTAKKVYPLTELLRCAICGHYLGFTERTDRKGLLSIKKCWFRNKFGEKCVNRSSSMNELVSYINSEISRYVQDIEQDISSVDARVLEKITQSIKDCNSAIKTKERALEKEQLAYQKGIYDVDEYASVRNKLKEEYKQLEGKVKALELEYSLLKDKSSTEKLNMLNEFQTLMSNPLLTWEEQNALYKTIIEYIDYKCVENSLTIEIKFK